MHNASRKVGNYSYDISQAPLPTERQVHRAILQMIRLCFPMAITHHSPNGAHLAGGSTARFRQMGALLGDGMLKGFPDILVLWPHGRGCLIEVKRPKLGRLSHEQRELHARLDSIGWRVATCTSVVEAYAFLQACGAPWSGAELAA